MNAREGIKKALNRLLRPLGAQLAGTGAERDEEARLQRLVESRHWDAARFEKATGWDVPRFRNFLDTVCRPYAADYARFPTNSADAGDGYYLNNGWFDGVDAEVLYSIIRHTAPATIVEVGSGNSTRLMRRAIREGSASTRIISIDPQPRADVHAFCDEHIPQPVERLRQEDIAARLSPGDILFIDSSHIIRTGGDVVFLYLELLPSLPSGILVHAHDIFLPFEYPERFILEDRCGWNEQYLVAALLYGGTALEVLWPSCFMWTRDREFVKSVIPSEREFPPSSLWFRVGK